VLKFLILLLPILVYASVFEEILKGVDDSYLLKSKKEQTKALKKLIKAKEAKNYPKIDFKLNAIRLKDTPTSNFNIPNLPPMTLPVGTRSNLSASLMVTYPILQALQFTNSIDKAKLKVIHN